MFCCVPIPCCCQPRRADGDHGSRTWRQGGCSWAGRLRSLTRRKPKRSDAIGTRLAEVKFYSMIPLDVCCAAHKGHPGLGERAAVRDSGAEAAPEPDSAPSGASAALEAGVVSAATPAGAQEPAGDPAPGQGQQAPEKSQPGPAPELASAPAPVPPPVPGNLAATLGDPEAPGETCAAPFPDPDTARNWVFLLVIMFLIFYLNHFSPINVK
ncbi:translation initiation factor IF-2-like isoform X1 [Suricata suricatta]|uniref:translation initiation factor IF-2-like isoform X1 n=1 Tax=Suricata suricatta TaxID=37032 RepID=UPI001155D63B|nr:translation initiation factor IF-2-like isoform X1 [Suricata suricatta]